MKKLIVKILTRFKIWGRDNLRYGFYCQSSIFQPSSKIPPRKLELRLAWGEETYHLFYFRLWNS